MSPDAEAGELTRGTRLGPYEVVGPLGAGGMGLVVRAVDTRLGREVAIKVLYADAARDEKRLQRLVGEARAASALNHPNILTVFEMGESPRGPYVVTELVEGETLRAILNRGPIPLSRALDIATQALAGLAKAHGIGIIHRDLKPENLMVSRDGFVKILDFGLAKLLKPETDESDRRLMSLGVSATEAGMIHGTAGYMSPEQIRGAEVSTGSDLFSLGVVLYEMVSGRNPFLRETPADTFSAILRDRPRPLAEENPLSPPELAAIVDRALEKDPMARFADAREMEGLLRAVRRGVDSRSEEAPVGVPLLHKSEPASRSSERLTFRLTARRKTTRRALGAALLLLVLAGAAAILLPKLAHPQIDSLAVLPFASGSPDAEYLSDGMTESLTNSLSQVPGLKVVPRTVAFRYRGREADPRRVGRELRVGALLTGLVAKRGDIVVVQAELVDVGGGSQLWGGQFNRSLSGVLDLQEAIATQITEKLRGRLTGQDRERLARRSTENIEAYELYLKGRYNWNKRTEEGIQRAIEYFDRAATKDPKYALAYAGLADSYVLLGSFGQIRPRESAPRATTAAQKALALDPDLPEAHAALGSVRLLYDWNAMEAEKEFRQAIELNPSYATAHHGYGLLMLARSRFDEARTALRKAQELDPLSLIISADLGAADLYARRYDLAIEQFRKTLALDSDFVPAHILLALAWVMTSRPAEAVAEFEKATQLTAMPAETILVRAYAAHAAGNEAEALRIMEEFETFAKQRGVSAFHAASVYAYIGKKDEAFAWLERAYQDRSPDMPFLRVQPLFDRLQGDPRLPALIQKIGFQGPAA